MRYPRVYWTLRHAGHCAAKAMEIILDASRGDKYALAWIKACRHL